MIKRGGGVIQDLRKVKKGVIEFKIGQQSKKGGHRGNGNLKMGCTKACFSSRYTLADASVWHQVSDVATTFSGIISVWRQLRQI